MEREILKINIKIILNKKKKKKKKKKKRKNLKTFPTRKLKGCIFPLI
jgi:hypothetical protein